MTINSYGYFFQNNLFYLQKYYSLTDKPNKLVFPANVKRLYAYSILKRFTCKPKPAVKPAKLRCSTNFISSPFLKLYPKRMLKFFSGNSSIPTTTCRIRLLPKPTFSSVTLFSKSTCERFGFEKDISHFCKLSNVKCQRIGTFSNNLLKPKTTSNGKLSRVSS